MTVGCKKNANAILTVRRVTHANADGATSGSQKPTSMPSAADNSLTRCAQSLAASAPSPRASGQEWNMASLCRAEDIGGQQLSYAEVKAIASGNPAVLTWGI